MRVVARATVCEFMCMFICVLMVCVCACVCVVRACVCECLSMCVLTTCVCVFVCLWFDVCACVCVCVCVRGRVCVETFLPLCSGLRTIRTLSDQVYMRVSERNMCVCDCMA